MYWPHGISRKVHLSPTGLNNSSSSSGEEILSTSRTRTASHFLTLTRSTLGIFSVKPIQSIAGLVRTKRSLEEYGSNQTADFNPEADVIIITTDQHFVLIYHLVKPNHTASSGNVSTDSIYSYAPSAAQSGHVRSLSQSLTLSSINGKKKASLYAPSSVSLNSSFKSGSGEFFQGFQTEDSSTSSYRSSNRGGTGGAEGVGLGFGIAAVQIQFQVGIRIEGGLGCALATSTHLLVSALSPPAIQCIPWPNSNAYVSPTDPSTSQPQARTRTSLIGRMDWIVGGVTTEAKEIKKSLSSTEEADRRNETEEVEGKEKEVAVEEALKEVDLGNKGSQPHIVSLRHSSAISLYFWILSDGRVYASDVRFDSRTAVWKGGCFHGAGSLKRGELVNDLPHGERATSVSVNAKFSLVAIGREDGLVSLYSILPSSPFPYSDPPEPFSPPAPSHKFSLQASLKSTASYLNTGRVTSLQWTGDGHALAVGWEKGWAVWTTWGKYMGGSGSAGGEWGLASKNFNDEFMFGVKDLFWGPGNTQLFFLSGKRPEKPFDHDSQLFSLLFAKSAVAGQHSPDNTRYAFVQLDSSLLVYRGAEQPDLSIINPETEAWQHILIPSSYLSSNWPIRYASISSDGQLIAVAGRRGLAHYSASSGKWKTYTNKQQEANFSVRGGLQWFQHVLIAACDAGGAYQIRLYSRDEELDNSQLLHIEVLNSPVVLSSLFDNSLLVYTEDNTFYHFLIEITQRDIRLTLCGSMSFEGVVGEPMRVRGMSWLVEEQQQKFGDPVDDLTVATIIFLIDGKLVLLRPRKVIFNPPPNGSGVGDQEEEEEVAYDMQILGDQIEYYWTHLQGIQTLENSLWGYDGRGIKVWLNALKIRADSEDDGKASVVKARAVENEVKTVRESLNLEIDFYPLCVLMEKGIVIGAAPEVSLRRNLEFAIFRSNTNTHLFIHQVLRYYLERSQLPTAVLFASHYQSLVYFSHALEILLHTVLEDEADAQGSESTFKKLNGTPQSSRSGHRYTESVIAPHAVLPRVVDFLDHFSESLEVVVNCARKTELARWSHLFAVVGSPKDLFEKCLSSMEFKTAASYLLVIHNLENIEESTRLSTRLLKKANQHKDFNICRDLLRFLKSMDDTGEALRKAVKDSKLLPEERMEVEMDSIQVNGYTMNDEERQTYSLPTPPIITRSSSESSSILSDAPSEADSSSNLNLGPPNSSSNRSRNASPSWLSSGGTAPPLPEITASGRIMPSRTNSTGSISPIATRHSQGPSPQPSRRNSGSVSAGPAQPGLGMSLSRVGLRSAERVWESSGSNNSPSPKSPGGGSWLGPKSPSSLKEELEDEEKKEESSEVEVEN